LFLLIFFVAVGALLWMYWRQRGSFKIDDLKRTDAAKKITELAGKVSAGGDSIPVTKDSSALCAWLQGQCRELLVKHGLTDSQVLKSFNAEREAKGVRWVEQTLEVRTPAGFKPAKFQQELSGIIKPKGLTILRNEKKDHFWTLEVGYKDRVFERILFHGRSGASSSQKKPVGAEARKF
jgi:hypothetical protein